jgi:Fe-S cluster assembly protein SufD
MPDPLSEEWRRTDVSKLTLEGLRPFADPRAAIASPEGLPKALRPLWDARDDVAARIVQLDSDVVFSALEPSLAGRGAIVTDLHTAAREHEHIVREYLLSAVSPGEWKYLGMHGALWSGGCLVYVPAGVEVELPIEYGLGITEAGLLVAPHVLIVAEENSRVTVIQESLSAEADGLTVVSGAVEVIARPGAEVRFVDVQRYGQNVQNFSTTRALVAKDASFQAIVVGLGADMTKARLEAKLVEPGGHAELLGLFLGEGDQHFDYDTRQDHIAPHTISDLLFKSTLTERSSMVWTGVVDVRKTASQAEANQTSRNLLLSDQAKAAPIPILEISAYDVTKCSHGASVGPVDEEQLYYMQTRGIPADEAERMLVEGFFAEVVERVPSERLRGRVQKALAAKVGWLD